MRGMIFDIKRYAIHDGPGIRTTVFLKGCSLHCPWCHNPESQSLAAEEMDVTRKIGERVFHDKRIVGYQVSVEELMKEIRKDYVFFEESDGGVTFSGGEPLCQADFLAESLKMCKEGKIHTCVDTSGAVVVKCIDEIIQYTDLFLYDVKTASKDKFISHIGGGFETFVDNLRRISDRGKKIIIRIPVVKGFNDDDESISEIIDLLKEAPNVHDISLLPFHRTGFDKYRRLGRHWLMGDMQNMKAEELAPMAGRFRQAGFSVSV